MSCIYALFTVALTAFAAWNALWIIVFALLLPVFGIGMLVSYCQDPPRPH